MNKKMIFLFVVAILGAAVFVSPLIAEEAATVVGNKICPVSGEALMEGQEAQVEHNGKIYNLCCKACEKDFTKDPESFIKKLEAMNQPAEAPVEEHKSRY